MKNTKLKDKGKSSEDRIALQSLIITSPTVGSEIKRIREELGVSQAVFADRIGQTSKHELKRWEAGKKIPFDRLTKIAQLGNVPTDWLIFGAQDNLQGYCLFGAYRQFLRLDFEIRKYNVYEMLRTDKQVVEALHEIEEKLCHQSKLPVTLL